MIWKKKVSYKMTPAKEDKDKIRMLKTEITQMKRDNYEFFQEHFGGEEIKEPFGVKMNFKLPIFLLGAALLSIGIFKLLSVFEFEKALYLGNRVIPQQTAAILFIAGVVMLYFAKEKSAPVIVMFLGIAATAVVFIISGKPRLTPLEGADKSLALISTAAGAVICGVTVYLKERKR